jgi:glycosyltransferase involved in cell wall biosynthesis
VKIILDFGFTIAGGVKPYFYDMMNYISSIDKDNKYVIITTKNGYQLIKNFSFTNNIEFYIDEKLDNRIYRIYWEQFILPKFCNDNNADILYCFNNRIPFKKMETKKIFLLGTLGPFIREYVDHFSFKERLSIKFLEFLIVKSLKNTDLTIFESHFTKDLVTNKYGFKGKAIVNHHGKPMLNNHEDYNDIDKIKIKYKLSSNYFLFTTYIRKYKKIEDLIKAYALAKKDFNKEIDFVLAGPIAPNEAKSYKQSLINLCEKYGVEDSFKFIGMVEGEELKILMQNCYTYVFASSYENLSYSLVEAISFGLPIITTTATAMPETCGDAALYYDPKDLNKLVSHMVSTVNNDEIIIDLKKKSLIRAKNFRNMEDEIKFNLEIFNKIINE